MQHTQATVGSTKTTSTKTRSAKSALSAKAKSSNMPPPSSEARDTDSEVVGSSRKRKRSPQKATSKKGLDFNKLPPATQKELMKQAMKAFTQAKNASASADADAGMCELLLAMRAY
jgi:hypothetical protein